MRNKAWKNAFLFFFICGVFIHSPVFAKDFKEQLRDIIRNRIEVMRALPQYLIGREKIYAVNAVADFYESRAYHPAWIKDYIPLDSAESLLNMLLKSDEEGLRVEDYHAMAIKEILNDFSNSKRGKIISDAQKLADLELMLSDAFFVYGAHLLSGRISPFVFDYECFADIEKKDITGIVKEALDTYRVEKALADLLSEEVSYKYLKAALKQYREINSNGGWPVVSSGPKLKKGDKDARVIEVRERIAAEVSKFRDLDNGNYLFDEELAKAVIEFQELHGLTADGVIGKATISALNVDALTRIDQIILNMERLRWLPKNLGKHYILVNAANFRLSVIEDKNIVLDMKIIVGKNYRRTPCFSSEITYLVLNPFWHVPPRIAVEDKLPLIKKDVNYFNENQMKLFLGWGSDAKEIDPFSINWANINSRNFIYHLRQDPGPNNALGRVKFMFPNRFNVYLHDTPSRDLFSKTERAFSSGCIRIEKPIELAEYLLREDPKWTREAILAALEKSRDKIIRLPKPMPVHLLYMTVFTDKDGNVNFRNDIYGRDAILNKAMKSEMNPF